MRLDVSLVRYLTKEEYRILVGIEMGMRNHEVVPQELISQISKVSNGETYKLLSDLSRNRLVTRIKELKREGYKLTVSGYDYLALYTLQKQEAISGVGRKIGVGKESDVYLVTDSEKNEYALKLHRLGRTSFRNVKEKRDYLGNRLAFSWLYLSRLSALRELAYMRLLSENGFPVPTPIGNNRHAVVMSVVNGILLQNVMELSDPGSLYGKIISLMVKLAESGLIHSDYNEFNIMIDDDSNPVLIDFPQMVSIDHVNAGMYFDRDLKCIKTYFLKKFKFESGDPDPKLSEISRNSLFLDVKSHASGSQRLSRKKLAELAEVCPPLVPSEDSSEQDAVDYEYSEDDVAAARINPLEDIFSKLALEDSKQSGDPRDSSCIRKNFKKHISKKYSRPKKTKSNIIKNPNSRYANDQVKNLSCDVWG